MRYKRLLDILKKDEPKPIMLSLKEMIPFVKYITEKKYYEKLEFKIRKGKVIITKPVKIYQPIVKFEEEILNTHHKKLSP